jgi:hypothetical protein
MFHHVVLYRVRPEPDARMRLETVVRSLAASTPGIVAFHAGPNAERGRGARGYDWGFCMVFVDRQARDDYLTSPSHDVAAVEILAAVEDLVVLGLDD